MLTGRTRFRPYVTDTAVHLVLQVQFLEPVAAGVQVPTWRDATVEDLSELHHLNYSHIHLTATVRLPEAEALPGESNARTLH